MTVVAFLHPGAMGASLAALCSGERIWVGDGRSPQTERRARLAGMRDAGSLRSALEQADIVVSVCPPGSAVDVAESVADLGFVGIYVDANAVAPSTARMIGERFERFVDGGIIGPPAGIAGTTRLYLCGDEASTVAALWEGTTLDTRVVTGQPGAASAVKACFASWTKGTSALLLAIRALAKAEGVEQALLAEWATSMPTMATQCEYHAASTGPKAWRFVGEMQELATAFAGNGLPWGFLDAAAEVYRRMAPLRGAEGTVDVGSVVELILRDSDTSR